MGGGVFDQSDIPSAVHELSNKGKVPSDPMETVSCLGIGGLNVLYLHEYVWHDKYTSGRRIWFSRIGADYYCV